MILPSLHFLRGGTKRQRRLYGVGLNAALLAINSPQFRYSVLDFSYTDANGLRFDNFKRSISVPWMEYAGTADMDFKELANNEVYKIIMSGWDAYHQEKDGDIDVEATLYYKRFTSTVGWTTRGSLATHSNTKFWTGTEREIIARIAGNIIHEYMHNLGFGHDRRRNPTRRYTVPYAIGIIVRNLVLESNIVDDAVNPEIEYDKVLICRRAWYYLWLRSVCRYESVGN